MSITGRVKNAFQLKALWLSLLIVSLRERAILADNFDVVSSCTRIKQSVFDKHDDYSFLLHDAPIVTKTLDTCQSYTPLIDDGQPVQPKEFPHMARLGIRDDNNNTNWLCGGTLISNRLVLTAAHCLNSAFGSINIVRLGELEFDSDTDDADPEDFRVLNITEHPDFKYPQLYNDIAILELDRGVRYTVYKHPACLPFSDGGGDDSFVATGWGHTTFGGKDSKILRKVKLDNIGNGCMLDDEVAELPKGYNASTQLCIGSTKRRDTCNGDSGGPVLTYHNEYPCMYHVMGVTSLGIGCGTPNVPSIYTRVHAYLGWIRQVMENLS